MNTVKLDDIDKQILRILQVEGRISNKELATRINLTTTPTLERVRRLEREGVIASYEAKVDPKTVNMGDNRRTKVKTILYHLHHRFIVV